MKTIAIIDDDIYIGNLLEEVLRGNGYEILRAYSGTEALYVLQQHKPDLVLLGFKCDACRRPSTGYFLS